MGYSMKLLVTNGLLHERLGDYMRVSIKRLGDCMVFSMKLLGDYMGDSIKLTVTIWVTARKVG